VKMCVEERFAAEEKVYCCRKLFRKKDMLSEERRVRCKKYVV